MDSIRQKITYGSDEIRILNTASSQEMNHITLVSLVCDPTDLALWVRSLWFSGVEPEAGGEGRLAPARVAGRIHSLTCMPEEWSQSVLRIRDLYPGYRFFPSLDSGSRNNKKEGNFNSLLTLFCSYELHKIENYIF
jgi:hypothetical protein